jgi:hypothetical protein
MFSTMILFSFTATQNVTNLSVQALEEFYSVSMITLPTTLLLLRSCSKYPTCAAGRSLRCVAG